MEAPVYHQALVHAQLDGLVTDVQQVSQNYYSEQKAVIHAILLSSSELVSFTIASLMITQAVKHFWNCSYLVTVYSVPAKCFALYCVMFILISSDSILNFRSKTIVGVN